MDNNIVDNENTTIRFLSENSEIRIFFNPATTSARQIIGKINNYDSLLQENDILKTYSDAWQKGYNKLKEQNNSLLEALKNIAAWPGNLPDERYLSKTGANDAALRGSMVVTMRQLAKAALQKAEETN